MDPKVELWYGALVALSVLNPLLLVVTACRNPLSTDPERRRYQLWMLCLAIPFVVECAWRGVFPSLYLQRFTFWDTPLNAILVDRTWACVGELAYVGQTAIALVHLDGELRDGGTRWVRASGAAMLVVYVFAEAASYYNVATTNELWAAIEVAIDALAYVCIAPAVFSLRARCPADAARSARGGAAPCGAGCTPRACGGARPRRAARARAPRRRRARRSCR